MRNHILLAPGEPTDLSQAELPGGTPPANADAAPKTDEADDASTQDDASTTAKPDKPAKQDKPAKSEKPAAKAKETAKSEKPAAKPAADDAAADDDDEDALDELLRDADEDGEDDGDDTDDDDATDEDADAALEDAAKDLKASKGKPAGDDKGKKKPADAADDDAIDDDEDASEDDDETDDDEDLDDVEVDKEGKTVAEKRDAEIAKQLPEPLRPVYTQVQKEARDLIREGQEVLGIDKSDKKGMGFLTKLVKSLADQVVVIENTRLELAEIRDNVQSEKLWAKADPDFDRLAEELGAEDLLGMSSKRLTEAQRAVRLAIAREAGELRASANARLKSSGKQLDALTVMRRVIQERLAETPAGKSVRKREAATSIKRKLGASAPSDSRKAKSLDEILREARKEA